MLYLGDFLEDATIPFLWSTNAAAGGSVDRATDGTIKVERDDGTDCTGTSITDSEGDPDTGLHRGSCDSSDNANFATNHFYFIWVDGAGIDGETVNGYLACFSIEYAGLNKQVDVVKISNDEAAATNLETMLDGDGGATLSLGALVINGSRSAGVVDLDNSNGPALRANGSTMCMDLNASNGAAVDARGSYGFLLVGSNGDGFYSGSSGGGGAGLRLQGAAGDAPDLELATSGTIENAGGDILANLDAAITSRNSVTPDAAGTAAGLHATTDGKIPTAVENADALLKRAVSNVEDDCDDDSLGTVILAMFHSSADGTTWTITKTDGSTVKVTKTLATDQNADPITGVS